MRRLLPVCVVALALLAGGGLLLWKGALADKPLAADPIPQAREKTQPQTVPDSVLNRQWPPPRREGVNGAQFYKDAAALLDEFTDAEKAMLRKPFAEADPEAAEQLLEKIGPILELLQRGGEADYVDWGLGEPDFEHAFVPANLASNLGRVGLWAADAAFEMQDPATAVELLGATTSLGYHVSDLLVGHLVQLALETRAVDLGRKHAGALDSHSFELLTKVLTSPDLSDGYTRSMQTETAALLKMQSDLKDPAKSKKLMALVEEAAPSQFNADTLRSELGWAAQMERDFAAAASSSEGEYEAWLRQNEPLVAAHPLAALVLPQLKLIREKNRIEQVRRAMLGAGLQILHQGTHGTLDPSTGAAFEYVETENGFELRSPTLQQGKPLSMSFPLE